MKLWNYFQQHGIAPLKGQIIMRIVFLIISLRAVFKRLSKTKLKAMTEPITNARKLTFSANHEPINRIHKVIHKPMRNKSKILNQSHSYFENEVAWHKPKPLPYLVSLLIQSQFHLLVNPFTPMSATDTEILPCLTPDDFTGQWRTPWSERVNPTPRPCLFLNCQDHSFMWRFRAKEKTNLKQNQSNHSIT